MHLIYFQEEGVANLEGSGEVELFSSEGMTLLITRELKDNPLVPCKGSLGDNFQ
jgi:hypothetical protein